MRLSIEAYLDYQLSGPADLLFALEAAQLPDQVLVTDNLLVGGVDPMTPVAAEESLGRRTWARGSGRITARYTATLDVHRPAPRLQGLYVGEKSRLPASVVQYLFPSRYCEADRFQQFVHRQFGHLGDGDKAAAIAGWIRDRLEYAPGSSDSSTSAADTFIARRGVCRDFAHLMIAMARAADIPARMVGAYAWRLDPQDFHAVVEVWLGGAWHLVDPTGLAPCDGIVRIGVGRDATDISFLTVFGEAQLIEQWVNVKRLDFAA
jgi:transglutaminase-like putative cysteine protease